MKNLLENSTKSLLKKFHKNCLFKNILEDSEALSFTFDSKGNLKGRFYCDEKYQGYNNRIHGGILAAIIDESMVHCLMGHGIVGVTTHLDIKYRMPISIKQHIEIVTCIYNKYLGGALYKVKTEVIQGRKIVANATASFFTDMNKLTN